MTFRDLRFPSRSYDQWKTASPDEELGSLRDLGICAECGAYAHCGKPPLPQFERHGCKCIECESDRLEFERDREDEGDE